MRKESKYTNYPDDFIENDKTVNNTEAVVKAFNKVFADEGIELAAKTELKIKENTPMSKTSEDWNQIDVSAVKNITTLTRNHMCYLAFQVQKKKRMGKNENRKVILPFKSRDRCRVTNYRPFSLLPTSPKQ